MTGFVLFPFLDLFYFLIEDLFHVIIMEYDDFYSIMFTYFNIPLPHADHKVK